MTVGVLVKVDLLQPKRAKFTPVLIRSYQLRLLLYSPSHGSFFSTL